MKRDENCLQILEIGLFGLTFSGMNFEVWFFLNFCQELKWFTALVLVNNKLEQTLPVKTSILLAGPEVGATFGQGLEKTDHWSSILEVSGKNHSIFIDPWSILWFSRTRSIFKPTLRWLSCRRYPLLRRGFLHNDRCKKSWDPNGNRSVIWGIRNLIRKTKIEATFWSRELLWGTRCHLRLFLPPFLVAKNPRSVTLPLKIGPKRRFHLVRFRDSIIRLFSMTCLFWNRWVGFVIMSTDG